MYSRRILEEEDGVEKLTEIREKIRKGLECGKSADYFRRLLNIGCPSGRYCGCCRFRNRGKALCKGKGKGRRNAPL
jgi:hypothetical protein